MTLTNKQSLEVKAYLRRMKSGAVPTKTPEV